MKKKIYLIIVILSGIYMQGCSTTATQNAESTDEHTVEAEVDLSAAEMKTADLKLVKAEKKNMRSSLKVNGVLHAPPQSLVSVSAPMGGFIVKTDLLPGMKVRKGQVLAVLEHQDYVQLQEEYLSGISQLKYLKAEYERQEVLQNENVNSRKTFELAESKYMEMRARLSGMREKLAIIGIDASQLSMENISRRISITCPINGYVSAVGVNIGKFVNPADVMFEIVNTEHLHAELTVFEKDVTHVKVGQKVEFELPNSGKEIREASVYLIGRVIDEDRAVRVHAHLDKEDTDLLPGMYISARIFTSDMEDWALPDESVIMDGGKFYVFRLIQSDEKTYHFEKVEVIKGVSIGGYTQVEFPQGLDPETTEFAGNGAFSLHAKMSNSEEEDHGH